MLDEQYLVGVPLNCFGDGMAVAAVQLVPPGVYIAMNGQVFPEGAARKNRGANRFERVPE